MIVTREDLVKAFALWTVEFKAEGDTSKTEVGTPEHEEECADYFIGLLNKINK